MNPVYDKDDLEFLANREKVIHLDPQKDSHGWIQWKGTSVCMDVHCMKCGTLTHVDDEFLYFVKCGNCKTVYEVNGHVELIEHPEYVTTDNNRDDITESESD